MAILYTIIFYAGFVLILVLSSFKVHKKVKVEQGVEISTADFEMGGGGGGGSSGDINDPNQEGVSSDEKIATQNGEDVPVHRINSDNKKNTQNNTTTVKENPKTDSRITNIKWGQGSGTGQGNGNGSGIGPGTGSGTGGGNGSGNGTGNGPGNGPGTSYSLGGRGAKSIPMPTYDEPDQGKVVVTIYVDKEGKVVRAVPGGKGTTVSNPSLWARAKAAALKAKFAKNPDAPEEQKGTITYYFIRQN